jgi:signal transduction histidine kinase
LLLPLLTYRGEKADVCIEVANRGPLIDPATLSQIFEPLRRGMARDDQPGLGLGLVASIR